VLPFGVVSGRILFRIAGKGKGEAGLIPLLEERVAWSGSRDSRDFRDSREKYLESLMSLPSLFSLP
jgi:hypothetical protein